MFSLLFTIAFKSEKERLSERNSWKSDDFMVSSTEKNVKESKIKKSNNLKVKQKLFRTLDAPILFSLTIDTLEQELYKINVFICRGNI